MLDEFDDVVRSKGMEDVYKREAQEIHQAGDNVLKHRDNRGKSGEAHKYEKERAPDAAALHGIKHIRQCDKNQIRAAVRIDMKGGTGGKNNQAGNQGHTGIPVSYTHLSVEIYHNRLFAGNFHPFSPHKN